MKVQDIIFIVVIIFLLYKRKAEWFAFAGVLSFIIAIPFYVMWIFFTAQRLVEYAFYLLIIALLLFVFKKRYHK